MTHQPLTQHYIYYIYHLSLYIHNTYIQEYNVHVDRTARHICDVLDPQGIDATVEQVEHRQCVVLGEEDLSFK